MLDASRTDTDGQGRRREKRTRTRTAAAGYVDASGIHKHGAPRGGLEPQAVPTSTPTTWLLLPTRASSVSAAEHADGASHQFARRSVLAARHGPRHARVGGCLGPVAFRAGIELPRRTARARRRLIRPPQPCYRVPGPWPTGAPGRSRCLIMDAWRRADRREGRAASAIATEGHPGQGPTATNGTANEHQPRAAKAQLVAVTRRSTERMRIVVLFGPNLAGASEEDEHRIGALSNGIATLE
ncbi:hypothetical protein RJ55_08648 [Drechmeria coniospora]|nr:hypothetical protein RJ55_08648 [Drechmeria coniospora]